MSLTMLSQRQLISADENVLGMSYLPSRHQELGVGGSILGGSLYFLGVVQGREKEDYHAWYP